MGIREGAPKQAKKSVGAASNLRSGAVDTRFVLPSVTREQLAFVQDALADGLSERQVWLLMNEPGRTQFGLTYMGLKAGKNRVHTLVARVLDLWKREDDQKRSAHRAQAIRRIEADMQRAREEIVTPSRKHGVLVRYHALLADIQGTRANIQVDLNVNVSHAVIAVIAEMTPEQVQAAYERYASNVTLAQKARELGAHDPTEDAGHPDVSKKKRTA